MKAYEIITERILQKLAEGVIPWRKPWAGANGMPKNTISRKEYRGVNVFLLHMQGYASLYWLTFRQARQLGGSVKEGAKGSPVIFWNWRTVKGKEGEDEEKQIPLLRYYTVFNVEQCEDLKLDIESPAVNPDFNPIAEAEKIVHGMLHRPEVTHHEAQAYYSPARDTVNMPKPNLFKEEAGYYSTLFHELVHSTGHGSRLNREAEQKNHAFGSRDYSKEELIAEMGASFLCGAAGIENATLDNSAAYIAGWLKKLQDDKQMVIFAAAKAQRAADYILNRQGE